MTVKSFSADWKIALEVTGVPNDSDYEMIPSMSTKTSDGVDDLLDILEEIPILIPLPIPTPIPIPLPVIIRVVKKIKEIIFGSGEKDVPDVDDWNRYQEEVAQQRAIALREARTQINMEMANFQKTVQESFAQQLEEIYREVTEHIHDNLLKAQEENSRRIQKQQQISDVENRLMLLLKEIK